MTSTNVIDLRGPMQRVLETDSRGRVSLRKLGIDSNTYFQATVLESGNVLLEPLEFRTALEASLERTMPDLAETVAANRAAGLPSDNSALDKLAGIALSEEASATDT